MMIIVDRFEAEYAVLELQKDNGELMYKNLPLDWLPGNVAEGDVLKKSAGGYVIDDAETAKRRAAVNEKWQAFMQKEDTL